MFPIPWNKAYRKKDGTLVNIDDAMGGGGGSSDIPEYSSADAGKVLMVTDDDELAWNDNVPNYGVYSDSVIGYGVFKPSDDKYVVGVFHGDVLSSATRTFGNVTYDLSDVFTPQYFNTLEFYNYLTDAVITGLELELLYDGIESAVESAELAHAITDYDVLVLQGCYSTTQTSEYNTTMFYVNPDIARTYWFGVKDRNPSYSGILSFTDATHVSLSVSRRIKIYGIKFE